MVLGKIQMSPFRDRIIMSHSVSYHAMWRFSEVEASSHLTFSTRALGSDTTNFAAEWARAARGDAMSRRRVTRA
jgi:hypothetical protein